MSEKPEPRTISLPKGVVDCRDAMAMIAAAMQDAGLLEDGPLWTVGVAEDGREVMVVVYPPEDTELIKATLTIARYQQTLADAGKTRRNKKRR